MSINIQQIFDRFSNAKALILGDVMLDAYLMGDSNRISPEAPVPVVDIHQKKYCLGGAANVAMNIKSLGGEAILCSVTGNDQAGEQLSQLLTQHNIPSEYMLKSSTRPTTIKTRIFSRNQQMLRFDEETLSPLADSDSTAYRKLIIAAFNNIDFDVVVIQDYDKGVLEKMLIWEVIQLANKKQIPIAVDPKQQNFFEYAGVTLFKPNLKEVADALNLRIEQQNYNAIKKIATTLKEKLDHEITLITLSSEGVFISNKSESQLIPATVRNIADVSGAGDTVISVAALCLSQQLDLKTLAILSNIAGGLVCEEVGVTPVDKVKLLAESLAAFNA